MALRAAFLGSADFALPGVAALLEAGHEIACVYTQPSRPAGRGQGLRETPVARFAAARGLEIRTPKSLKRAAEQEAFAALKLDVAVVIAYGLILPSPILDAPRLGCVNVHGSLLPRWRGAAPIQRAIMAGDRETGVMTMRMDEGLDTGPVYAAAATPIEADDTAGAVHDRLALMGARLLVETLAALEAGTAMAAPQPAEGAVYAPKITPEETRIDWTRPAREVDCMIRGLAPSPGAWFVHEGARVKALACRLSRGEGEPGETLDDNLRVACGQGAVRLERVQRAGKAAMEAGDFLRGAPVSAGARFT